MSMLKPEKIKDTVTIQAGKWTDKVAFAAAMGLTGVVVWVAVSSYNSLKKKLDFELDDIDWDGK
jgi:hypothetical protein